METGTRGTWLYVPPNAPVIGAAQMNGEQLLEQWLKDFDAKQEALSLRQTSFLEKLGVREVTVGMTMSGECEDALSHG